MYRFPAFVQLVSVVYTHKFDPTTVLFQIAVGIMNFTRSPDFILTGTNLHTTQEIGDRNLTLEDWPILKKGYMSQLRALLNAVSTAFITVGRTDVCDSCYFWVKCGTFVD